MLNLFSLKEKKEEGGKGGGGSKKKASAAQLRITKVFVMKYVCELIEISRI